MEKRTDGAMWIRLAALAGIAAAVILTLKFSGLRLSDFTHEKIKGAILGYGAWAPVIYILLYMVRSVALVIPAGLVSIVGGLAFGKGLGFLYIMIGSEAGACLAFIVSRILGRPSVERIPWFQKGKLRDLDLSTETHGFRMVLYLRLVPVFPYDPINIAAGLSRIRFRDFAFASFIGLIPASIIEAVLGGSFGDFNSPPFILAALAWILMFWIPSIHEKVKKHRAEKAEQVRSRR